MLRKLTILFSLISFCPVAAGAQELAVLAKSQPAVEQSADREAGREINLTPPLEKQAPVVLAANDVQGSQAAESPRPHKTHTGLTFKEFAEVHWGGYRWIYWVGAVAAIAAIHVFAVD